MRLLPREHGATIIWLSATICAVATLPAMPSPVHLLFFIGASILFLVFIGFITSNSKVVMRMERNRVVLLLTSGLLSLIIPFGHLIMFWQITMRVMAIWLLFAIYTAIGVVYIQEAVRAFRNRRRPVLAVFVVSGTAIYVIVAITLHFIGWLNVVSVAAVIPLFVLWLWMRRWVPPEGLPKVRIVKKIGLRQTANMLAFTFVLAVLSWL